MLLRLLAFCSFSLTLSPSTAIADMIFNTPLAVWANEAIVATYTYDYQNFIPEQKDIAKYYTAEAWTSYSAAFTGSKIPEQVMKNSYFVSAVALLPVEIKMIDTSHWQASVPVVVVYRNPQFQQKQTLQVTIDFATAPQGQGVRGLAITKFASVVTQEPCVCKTN
mgnify:CR=1 FL=1